MPAFLNFVLHPCGTYCNLTCQYCYVRRYDRQTAARGEQAAYLPGAERATARFLSWFPTLLEGIGKLEGVSRVRFTWHGGEPLLAPHRFYETAIGMQRRFLSDSILSWDNVVMTNGVLLDEAYVETLNGQGVFIGVSCDGPSYRHNALRFRKREEFERLQRNLDRLRSQREAFSLVVVIHEGNCDAADEVFAMLRHLNPGNGVSVTPCAGAESSVSADAFASFLQRLYNLWRQERTPEIALFQNVECGLEFGVPAFCQLVGGRCKAFLTITADGVVYSGCEASPNDRYCVGRVDGNSISDLMKRHRDHSRQLAGSLRNECFFELLGEDLSYVYFQGQGCPHRADEQGRDPYAPAFAALIEHVHRSDPSRFARARARRFPDLAE